MKNIVLLFIILIFLNSGCNNTIFNLNSFILPDDLEFLSLIEELNTPKKIGDYMLSNFQYEGHPNYTLSPYELWQIKRGDCEDCLYFAIFMAHCNEYITYRMNIYWMDGKSHLLAIFKEKNYSFISNVYYYKDIYLNFEWIIYEYSQFQGKCWSKYTVYDYNNNVVEKGFNNQ